MYYIRESCDLEVEKSVELLVAAIEILLIAITYVGAECYRTELIPNLVESQKRQLMHESSLLHVEDKLSRQLRRIAALHHWQQQVRTSLLSLELTNLRQLRCVLLQHCD